MDKNSDNDTSTSDTSSRDTETSSSDSIHETETSDSSVPRTKMSSGAIARMQHRHDLMHLLHDEYDSTSDESDSTFEAETSTSTSSSSASSSSESSTSSSSTSSSPTSSSLSSSPIHPPASIARAHSLDSSTSSCVCISDEYDSADEEDESLISEIVQLDLDDEEATSECLCYEASSDVDSCSASASRTMSSEEIQSNKDQSYSSDCQS